MVGSLALRDIEASGGRLRGRRTAIEGIVLGALGSVVVGTVVYVAIR